MAAWAGKVFGATLAGLLAAGLAFGLSTPLAAAETDGGGIVPVTNWRLFATTSTTPMYSGQIKTLQVTGNGGIPSTGVSAVVVDVAASSTNSAYVTVAPSGSGQTASVLSVRENAGWDSNTAIVRVSSSGKVDLSVNVGATQVILDIQGYVTSDASTEDGGFVAVPQARIARSDTGQGFSSTYRLTGGYNYAVDVAGVGGVPADASAVYANVRVWYSSGPGALRVGPSNQSASSISALNYQATQAYDSAALIRLGTDGKIRLFGDSGTSFHVSIDVQGYVTPGDDGAGFTPIVPQTIVKADTEATHILGGETREVQVTGVGGVSEMAGAVMLNFMATTWTTSAALSLANADDPPSSVYQLSLSGTSTGTGQRTTVIAQVSAEGTVSITNHGTTPVGVWITALGWFSPTPGQAEADDPDVEPTPDPSETVPAPADPEEYDPNNITETATVTDETYDSDGNLVSTEQHGPETEGQILGSDGIVSPAGSGGSGGSSTSSGCHKVSMQTYTRSPAGFKLYVYKQWTYWCWNRATQKVYNVSTGWGPYPSSVVSWEGTVTSQKLYYDYGTNNGYPKSAYKHYRKGHLQYSYTGFWNYYPELLLRSYYNGTWAWWADPK